MVSFRRLLEKAGDDESKAIGALLIARDTRRILMGFRSKEGDSPHVWANIGGSCKIGENPYVALKRELKEEIGYEGPYGKGYVLYVNKMPGFTYINTAVFIPKEFEPTLNDEHEKAKWFSFIELKYTMNIHPGVNEMLENDGAILKLQELTQQEL